TVFGGTLTVNPTNSNIFRYTGATVTNVPGTVTADFNLTGGAGAIVDLINQNTEVTADNTPQYPTAAISLTAPETIGIDGSVFTSSNTLVGPVVFVKNNTLANDLAAITNLTQRNAAYLEAAAGT